MIDKKIVIYPGVTPQHAIECVEKYLATDKHTQTGWDSAAWYDYNHAVTGELVGTLTVYSTKTQIVIRGNV